MQQMIESRVNINFATQVTDVKPLVNIKLPKQTKVTEMGVNLDLITYMHFRIN